MSKPLIAAALLGSLFIIGISGHSDEKSNEHGFTSGKDQTTDTSSNNSDESTENPTEKTTKKSTDGNEKVIHGEKTTPKPTKLSFGKPDTNKHQYESRETRSEDSDGSTENPIEKVTHREKITPKLTKLSFEKPDTNKHQYEITEKSSEDSDESTENPIEKVTHREKTTPKPTKLSFEIPESNIYQTRCAENEKYERCPNKSFEPQTCEHLGFPCEDCGKGDEEDDCSDTGACICVKGYVRDRHGICMPAEICPSCRGDKNATLGCGSNCGNRCSDYMKEVECLEVCLINQCHCRDDYVYDEFTGKCVFPKDCTRKIPSNSTDLCIFCNKNDTAKSCKGDSGEEDGSAASDNNEDEDSCQCNKDSKYTILPWQSDQNKKENTGMSTTTSKPTSDSKCVNEAMKLFIQDNYRFSGRLLKELMRLKPEKNVLVSSPVVLFLLAQVGIYANGDAYKQILTALNFDNVETIKCYFKQIVPMVLNVPSVEYRLIGKIYSDNVCPLNAAFRKQTKKFFNFEPENLDFHNPQSAKKINQEISAQTHNRVVDFINPSLLSTLSGLVMVSAEYFQISSSVSDFLYVKAKTTLGIKITSLFSHGQWQNQFDPLNTKQRDFRTLTKTIKVPTMYQTGTFLYTESAQLDAKIIILKYVGGDCTLSVVLPKRVDGFKGVIEKIRRPDIIMRALDGLKMETVDVYLPIFNTTVANRLKMPIQKANITNVFSNKTAGLGDITSCSGTYVRDVLQKVTIHIDEFGAGHHKTTDFDMEETVPDLKNRKSCTFRADHPFIYFLSYHNSLIFLGVYLQ